MAERIGAWIVREQLSASPDHRTVRARGRDGHRAVLKIARKGTEAERLLRRETAVLRQIRHPAVPEVLDAFETPTHVILARPWAQGTDLTTLVAHRRLTEEAVLAIARDLLGVLVHLHGLSPRVAHRGIEPSHVILRDGGGLWLVGFGALADERHRQAAEVAAGITEAGHYPYAPEDGVLGGGPPADVYAVGMTVLHALGGQKPSGDALDPRSSAYNLTPFARGWLAGLLEPDPELRMTAREALNTSREPRPAPIPTRQVVYAPSTQVVYVAAPQTLAPWARLEATIAGLSVGVALGTWMLFFTLVVALLLAGFLGAHPSTHVAMITP